MSDRVNTLVIGARMPASLSAPDNAQAIAAFLRQNRNLSRGDLLVELLAAFPESTGSQIQAAINARPYPVLVLPNQTARAGS